MNGDARQPARHSTADTARTERPTAVARERRLRWRQSWWVAPALIALASRLWGSGLVYFDGATSWTGFSTPPAVGPATTWDGAWYLSIAHTGYHGAALLVTDRGGYHDFAFWPAWPSVLATLLHLTPDAWADIIASLAANILTIAGLVLWARVLEPAFGRRGALWTIAFVGFAPSAFILSMAYSEPLFLFAAAAFFLTRSTSLRRPVLAAIAQATRVTGFALGAAAIPALVHARGHDRIAWLTLIAPLMVFAGWWLFLAILTGTPTGFLQGTPDWLNVTGQLSGPLSFPPDLARDSRYAGPIVIWAIFMVGVVVGAARLFWRRLPEFGWYVAAALAPTLLFASWQSMPRHALVAVPAVAAFIQPLRDRWRWLLLALSIGAEVIVANAMVGIRLISP